VEWNEQKSQRITPKRLLTLPQVIVYSPYQRGGESNASILREVPCQEGDEGHQGYNHEEWQAGNPGCMPSVWYQDVQDWEELKQDCECRSYRLLGNPIGHIQPLNYRSNGMQFCPISLL
jgi:hypothetical protein